MKIRFLSCATPLNKSYAHNKDFLINLDKIQKFRFLIIVIRPKLEFFHHSKDQFVIFCAINSSYCGFSCSVWRLICGFCAHSKAQIVVCFFLLRYKLRYWVFCSVSSLDSEIVQQLESQTKFFSSITSLLGFLNFSYDLKTNYRKITDSEIIHKSKAQIMDFLLRQKLSL